LVESISAIPIDPSVRSFRFAEFNSSNLNQLQTVGLPAVPVSGDGELTLTDAVAGQNAAAWLRQAALVRGFRCEFTINMSSVNAEHHDGLAFVVQSESSGAQGVAGAGLGYGDENTAVRKGIVNSLAIEFDTHLDNDTAGPLALHDPNANHVSVQTRGIAQANSANHDYSLQQNTAIPPLSGAVHTVRIEYLPAKHLHVFILPLTGPVINITDTSPIEDSLALDQFGAAFVGFTASTSSASGERHAIGNWSFEFLGRPDPARCAHDGSGVSTAVAGDLAHFAVQLVDQFGNNFTDNTGVTLAATLSAAPHAISVSYAGLGRFDIAFNATVSGVADVNVTQDGVAVLGSPFRPTVVAAAVDASHCVVSINATTLIAGDALQVLVSARDRFDNSVLVGGATVTCDAIFNDTALQETHTAADEGNGKYAAVFAATKAGQWQLLVAVNGATVSLAPQSYTVRAAEVAASNCSADVDTQLASDRNNTAIIRLRDEFGNAVDAAQTVLQLTFDSADGGGGASSCASYQQADGDTVTALFNCALAGEYVLTIRVAPASSPAAWHRVGDPFELHVFPADAVNASASVLVGALIDAPQPAQLGALFNLTTFDFNGNRRLAPVANFSIECAPWRCAAQYFEFGVYQLSVNLTRAEAIDWNVSVLGEPIAGSPFAVQVVPAVAAAATSALVNSSALDAALTDEQVSVELQLRDRFDNDVVGTTWPPLAAWCESPLNEARVAVGVARRANGTALLTFTAEQAGEYQLHITLDGVEVQGSPYRTIVAWAGLSNELVLAIGGGLLLLVILIGVAVLYVRSRSRRKIYESI
jgi:hypothetical protein